MTKFYLIRHGKREARSGDPPLSEVGIAQAEATGHALRRQQLKSIYASPLCRAKQTAEVIARLQLPALSVSVIEDARLRERANWGDIPSQSFTDFITMWERSTHDPDYILPSGGTTRQAAGRFAAFLREVAATYIDGEALAVTHGGILADFLAYHIPEQELEALQPGFREVQSKIIAECSITVVEYDGERFALEQLAGVGHLTDISKMLQGE